MEDTQTVEVLKTDLQHLFVLAGMHYGVKTGRVTPQAAALALALYRMDAELLHGMLNRLQGILKPESISPEQLNAVLGPLGLHVGVPGLAAGKAVVS